MDEGWSMQSEFWFVIGILSLIIACGMFRTGCRIIRSTVSDTLYLALLTGVALAAGYLFS
jgi:hypothetical protein